MASQMPSIEWVPLGLPPLGVHSALLCWIPLFRAPVSELSILGTLSGCCAALNSTPHFPLSSAHLSKGLISTNSGIYSYIRQLYPGLHPRLEASGGVPCAWRKPAVPGPGHHRPSHFIMRPLFSGPVLWPWPCPSGFEHASSSAGS